MDVYTEWNMTKRSKNYISGYRHLRDWQKDQELDGKTYKGRLKDYEGT